MAVRQRPALIPRVGIYNRCSTEEEAQKNALAIQAEESREIAFRKNWLITAQYIESESGTTVKNRMQYQRLLEDMEKDFFDIIMIKSIDRLMRSAKDWYMFLNRLAENHKRLYIYIDDKFYTPDDSLISGIKAILAEEFSRELSKKIKNSHGRRQEMHRQKKQAGLNITRPMFGWDKVEKDVYIINEAEAEAYRTAFDMAKAGCGFYKIANDMYDQGIRGKDGNRISNVQWRKMLYSPRAHGTMIIHTREYDFDTKKFVDLPPEEWIYIDNALPAIVSQQYQEDVIRLMEDRRISHRSGECLRDIPRVGKYDLSGKIICSECNAVYYRTTFQSGSRRLAEWKCSTAIKSGRKASSEGGCDNMNLIEEELSKLIEAACIRKYGKFFDIQREIAEEALAAVRKAIRGGFAEKEQNTLKKEYDKLERKKKVLFDKLMNETITDHEFMQCRDELDTQLRMLSDTIQSMENKNKLYSDYETRLAKIKEALKSGGIIEDAQFKELLVKIDKVVVYPDHIIEIIFNKDKLLGQLRICDDNIADKEPDEDFCRIRTEYVHTNVFAERRKDINCQILDIFRQNPHMPAKELPGMLGVSYSYINASLKELKGQGKLQYKRNGNTHTGIWVVSES